MQFPTRKTIRRMVIILDVMSTTAAFILGIALRMWGHIEFWQIQLYATIYMLTILLYLFWNTYRRAKKHEMNLLVLDPFETGARTVRDKCLQYAALVVILAMTRSFMKVSRLALFYIAFSDMLITGVERLCYRHHLLRQRSICRMHGTSYIVVATREQASLARARVEHTLAAEDKVAAVYLWQDQQVLLQLPQLLEKIEEVRKEQEEQDYLRCVLYLPGMDNKERDLLIRSLRKRQIPVQVFLFGYGRCLPSKMMQDAGSFGTAEFDALNETCRVFGVDYTVSDVETAAFSILDLLEEHALAGTYLCFSNVHTLMMAQKDAGYLKILNDSAFTFPDGNPIADYQLRHGHQKAERIAGPDFMDAVFRGTMDGRVSHYFYGSTQETIDKLRKGLEQQYPGIRIAGMVSPPFRKETPEEDEETIRRINESGADFVWIGLGAPKQERWMAEHAGKLDGVMLGVGAGFDFYAGTIRRAPLWVQKIGLEWLYRLFQDPKRLANRYIVTNVQYLSCLVRERLCGGKN